MRTWNDLVSSSSSSSITEPDLRNEFRALVEGSPGSKIRGHWVLFRKSDTSRRSQYWDANDQEAIGGPPFEYKDILIRARYLSMTSGDREYRDLMGLIDRPVKIYYLDYRFMPKKEDYILEIAQAVSDDAPTEFTVTAKYNIILVDEPRDETGRIEYYICACEKVASRGDTTLGNISNVEML